MATLRSIYFPFQPGPAAFPRPANDDDAIRASIVQILMTRKGERVMRPDFGTTIWDYVFEADSDALRVNIERDIRSAISIWEPRVEVTQVLVESGDVNEPDQMIVTVFYVVISSGQVSSVTVAG